ncbi:MAG: hypothetical protein AAB874_07190 [Patescibacteria group bacterium]
MKFSLRLLYLYLFSAIGLLITVIGTVRLVDLGMKVFVFPDSDNFSYYAPKMVDGKPASLGAEEQIAEESRQKEEQQKERLRQRQRETTGALSMILVGLPLYLYHWKTIQKEQHSDK